MLKKLRTIVYHVTDLEKAKSWYSEMFKIKPYFDEPFYVGFDINGFELGLDPHADGYTNGNNSITYWEVDNIQISLADLKRKGVDVHQDIADVGGDIKTASVFDPFGNIIGLIQIPEHH